MLFYHFMQGASVIMHVICSNGKYEKKVLSTKFPSLIAMRDTWFAAEVDPEAKGN